MTNPDYTHSTCDLTTEECRLISDALYSYSATDFGRSTDGQYQALLRLTGLFAAAAGREDMAETMVAELEKLRKNRTISNESFGPAE